jgi:hypothetical protein
MEWTGNGEESVRPFFKGKMDFSMKVQTLFEKSILPLKKGLTLSISLLTNIDYQVWQLKYAVIN